MRKRTNSLTGSEWKLTLISHPSGAIAETKFSSAEVHAGGDRETIESWNTPNFLKRKAKGELLFNGVIIEKLSRRSTPCNVSLGPHIGFGTQVYTGSWDALWASERPYVYPSVVTTLKSDANNIAVTKAYAEIANAPATLLVTAAEMRETISMLGRPFKGADIILTGMLKRKASLLRKGYDVTRAIQKVWLEYRLGWKPLLFDISNIASAMAVASHQYFLPKREVSRGGHRFVHTSGLSSMGANNFVQTSLCTVEAELEYRANVGIFYSIQDTSFLAAEARRLGLRLSDIPAAAWELIPLSFVVDRFAMVGTWLNAIVPKPGVVELGSWITTVTIDKKQHTFLVSNTLGSPPSTFKGTAGPYRQKTVTVVRSLKPTLPLLPPLTMGELKTEQHLDHLALVLEKFSQFTSTR